MINLTKKYFIRNAVIGLVIALATIATSFHDINFQLKLIKPFIKNCPNTISFQIVQLVGATSNWQQRTLIIQMKSFGRKFYSGNGGYAATKFENRIEILMPNVYNFIAVRQADV